MNKRPGHVTVTTEVAYCSFCDRVRNLRREEHQLGTLVRTIVTCESCHRTLSSTIGVAEVPAPAEAPAAAESVAAAAHAPEPAKRPAVKRTATAKAKAAPATTKATKARTLKSK